MKRLIYTVMGVTSALTLVVLTFGAQAERDQQTADQAAKVLPENRIQDPSLYCVAESSS